MSASEVAPNPFWYAKSTAALSSRDRLSICVLAMFAHKSANRLNMVGIGEPVKPPACFCPAAVQSETGKVRNRRKRVVRHETSDGRLAIGLIPLFLFDGIRTGCPAAGICIERIMNPYVSPVGTGASLMPEIVADPSSPSCYHLFLRNGFQEFQRLGPDLFVLRAREAWADAAGG